MYRSRSGRNFSATSLIPGGVAKESRLRLARTGLLAFGCLLIVRLFILQVIDVDFYRALAAGQREIYRELFAERGEILIQDGKTGGLTPLAANKDVYLVYADPRLVISPKQTANKLASLLGVEPNVECPDASVGTPILHRDKMKNEKCDNTAKDLYQELVDHLSKKDDPYEPLKRGVEEAVAQKITDLKLPGIATVREPIRYYPLKNIGAQLAGFLGSDGEKTAGRYGIEGSFEKELAGEPGFFAGEKDIGGRWIPVGRRTLKPAINGGTVVLTIDRAIEYAACTKLSEAVKKHGASGGTVIIMEVQTGAILAMCASPDFDPNEYGKVEDPAVYHNLATFAQYEPGSVFKAITMAAALDAGEVTPETTYEDKGQIKIGPFTINNSDNKTHGAQTMTEVLEKSLNTGAMFAAQKVGVERFRDYITRFGFGVPTGIELKNEARGDIAALSKKGAIYLATASFGQGLSVTPIQLVQAIGAIANQGKMMKPYLVDEVRRSNGAVISTATQEVREVISPRSATLLSGMMVSVIERGHGKRAGVQGYYVAGKTGTAQIPRKEGPGYEQGATIGTFVGFAPVEKPKFVMLTRIDRPQDVQFAESSAAPLFGEIAKFLLQYYEVKPTRILVNK